MATITRTEIMPTKIEFIGRAWVHLVTKEGPSKGSSFMNVRIDECFKEVVLKPTDLLQLWPNQKREGSRDADFRLSIVSEAPVQGGAQAVLV